MRSVSILSVASLLALTTAQPAVKRDAITVTEIKTVVTTIDITKTVYAGEATPVHHQPPVHHHSHHHPRPVSSVVSSPSPVQPTIIPDSSLEQAQPTKPHTHVHTHTHTAQPPPPPPSTPTPTPTPTPSGPTGGAPADALVGEGTFYTPGLGSCGITNTESDFIVALALDKMNNGANPNTNPICGQKIHIVYNGVHQTAVVTDSCYACAVDDIDMTPDLFDTFADQSVGRLTGVKWWFENPSYM